MAGKVDLGFSRRNNKKTESIPTDKVNKENSITDKKIDLVNDLVSEKAPTPKKAPQRTKYVNFEEIYVNKLNEGLSMDEIEQLADSILQVGLQQPLLVIQDEEGKYRLISGHRRYHAIELLRNNGTWNSKIEIKEADLEDLNINISKETKELYVLLSGNINREKTPKDRLFEMQGWQKVYDELKENKVNTFTGIDGIEYELKKSRDFITKMSGLSSGDQARLKKIQKNAIDDVLEALDKNEISVPMASDLASLSEEEQKKQLEELKNTASTNSNNDFNFNLKTFNHDIKFIKSKAKAGLLMSDEDINEYNLCIEKLKSILEKY